MEGDGVTDHNDNPQAIAEVIATWSEAHEDLGTLDGHDGERIYDPEMDLRRAQLHEGLKRDTAEDPIDKEIRLRETAKIAGFVAKGKARHGLAGPGEFEKAMKAFQERFNMAAGVAEEG